MESWSDEQEWMSQSSNAQYVDEIDEILNSPARKRKHRDDEEDDDELDPKRPRIAALGGAGLIEEDDPRRESATATWAAHTAALIQDLTRLQDVRPEILQSPRVRSRLVRAITSVLLYKSHVASFLSLEPSGFPGGKPLRRQESPWDRRYPEVYYRSQREGHPQIKLYQEGLRFVRKETEQEAFKGKELVAPYNWDVKTLIEGSTKADTRLKKKVRAEKTPEGFTTTKEGHQEPVAGYAGLRKTNPQAVSEMVEYFLGQDEGLGLLIEFIQETADRFGIDLPEPSASRLPGLEEIWAVFDDAMEAQSRIGEAQDVEGAEDEEFDPEASYVTRKIGRTAARAQSFARGLSGLSRLSVKAQAGNPQVTIELKKFPEIARLGKSAKDSEVKPDYDHLVQALRIHLAARIAQLLADAGLPFTAGLRQSFGFADTTLANTEPSIRLSLGTEPAAYFAIVAGAIRTVDAELNTMVLGAKTGKDFNELFGTGGGKKKLATLGRPLSPNSLIAYYNMILEGHDLSGSLDYIKETLYGGDEKAEEKWEQVPELAKRSSQKLAKAAEGAARSASLSGSGGEMPILEPLSNLLFMAAGTLTDLSFQMAGRVLLGATGARAFAELRFQIAYVKRLLGDLGSGDSYSILSALRDAAEEIGENLLILLASQDRERDPAEPRVKGFFESALGKDVDVGVFRTDSGEQAAAVVLAALNQEQGQNLTVESEESRSYYEIASLLTTNRIKKGRSQRSNVGGVVADPRPYLNTVKEEDLSDYRIRIRELLARLDPKPTTRRRKQAPKQEEKKPPFTVVLDVTSLDYTDPEIAGLIEEAMDKVKSERVRFVLYNSAVKHEQLGLDKYQVGRVIVIGKALPQMKSFSGNPLVNQLLHLLQDLRDLDRGAADELAKLLEESDVLTPENVDNAKEEKGNDS